MLVSNRAVSEPRTPGLLEMGPPVLLAPVIATPVFAALSGYWPLAGWIAGAAAAVAVLIGWPLLFWLYDNGRTSMTAFAISGAIVGATPFLAALLSGIAGQYILNQDFEYIAEVLRHGASIPWYGSLGWPKFIQLAMTAVACGAVWGVASHAIATAAVSRSRTA